MGTFLVERYWPGVTAPDAADAVARASAAAAAMHAEGSQVRYLSCSLVPADEALFTYFEASSVDDVVEAHRRAGVPLDRINECVHLPC